MLTSGNQQLCQIRRLMKAKMPVLFFSIIIAFVFMPLFALKRCYIVMLLNATTLTLARNCGESFCVMGVPTMRWCAI